MDAIIHRNLILHTISVLYIYFSSNIPCMSAILQFSSKMNDEANILYDFFHLKCIFLFSYISIDFDNNKLVKRNCLCEIHCLYKSNFSNSNQSVMIHIWILLTLLINITLEILMVLIFFVFIYPTTNIGCLLGIG